MTKSNRRKTVTCALIVKNEAHVIERCLDSVAPYVDNILIHDTGSSDDTVEVIQRYIKANKLHGFVEEVEWVDFGHNRSKVLSSARMTGDYTFMLDADETLYGLSEDIRDQFATLTADTYQMQVKLGDCHFTRNFLFKNTRDWYYMNPVHEYAHVDGDFTTDTLREIHILSHHDGGRSKDPEKYAKDAALLESIEDRTPRQQFYLAQSLKDAGKLDGAMDAYIDRYMMEGYGQERFWSAYMLGQLAKSDQWLLRAYEIDPRRAEPLLALGKHYMDKGNFQAADMFLGEAACKRVPDDALFVETDVYEWRAQMELYVCMYYLGQYITALTCNERLLALVPDNVKPQVRENIRFCEEKLHSK